MNIGDIFYLDNNYDAITKECNSKNYMIVELESDNQGRRFQIQESPTLSIKELNQNRINELKQKLFDTDYKAIQFAEGELTAEEYEPMRLQRKNWRKEINELEKLIN